MTVPFLRVDARRNVERVLETAVRVLGDDPSASVEQVAAACGLHRSTVYRRFPTRDELLHAVVEQAIGEGTAIVASAAERKPSEATLRTFCEDMMVFGERYAFLQTHARVVPSRRDAMGLIKLIRCHQRAGILRSDLSAAWLARAFTALNLTLVEGARDRPDSTRQAAGLLADTFLGGALAPR
jgi:AcrR family transcriptional regulator